MRTLDTNICSYILRQRPPQVTARFEGLEARDMFLSALVAAELRYGAAKLGSDKFAGYLEDWLRLFDLRPWPVAASLLYASLRRDLERQGTPIGSMDLLIAAHALAENAVLVTNNLREFGRVPNLRLENWMEP
ncbi:MAG: type II toxin-antitoxin system VapC family toxin [Candidatus Contendobacter sp.]